MNEKTIPTLALVTLLGVLHATQNAEAQCNANQVKLHLDTNRIHVTPPDARCVTVPGSFTIHVKSHGSMVDPAVGEVVVHEKSSSSLEIRGTNDPDRDVVVVQVNGTAAGGSDHGYVIEIDGHGMLDPEVRIVIRAMLLKAQIEAAKTLLEEELGLSLEEFEAVLREFRAQKME